MLSFITDETNIDHNNKHPFDFFVYGGIVVNGVDFKRLNSKLSNIKKSFNISDDRPVKWSNQKWKGYDPISPDQHKALKNQVLDMFAASHSSIILVLSPQDFYYTWSWRGLTVSKSIDPVKLKRTFQFAMNDALGRFDSFLHEVDETGIVLHDSFDERVCEHMRDYCLNKAVRMSRIVCSPIPVDDSYSSIHQINDIVIGAVAYSLQEAAYNFLPLLKDRFWRGPQGILLGRGITVYPQRPYTDSLAQKKETLENKIIRRMG